MNRPIKFRAWARDVKVMHPIWNVVSDEGGVYVLMQFTGLLDKNGKEIYEGDVVRASAENTAYDWRVEWIEENAGLTLFRETESGALSELPFFHVNHVERMEIIGNIYENPELLK